MFTPKAEAEADTRALQRRPDPEMMRQICEGDMPAPDGFDTGRCDDVPQEGGMMPPKDGKARQDRLQKICAREMPPPDNFDYSVCEGQQDVMWAVCHGEAEASDFFDWSVCD